MSNYWFQDKDENLNSDYWITFNMNEKRERQIVELKNLLREMSVIDIDTAEKELGEELKQENLADAKKAFRSLSEKGRLQVLIEYLITKK